MSCIYKMTVLEAPIIHGTISVNNLFASSQLTINGSTITAVDTLLDANSTNPLTSAATKVAIDDAINSISTSVGNRFFHVHMITTTNHIATGKVSFGAIESQLATFDSVTPVVDSVVQIPVDGTYNISARSTAAVQANTVQMAIVKDGSELRSYSGEGTSTFNGVFYLQQNSALQLHAMNATEAFSEFTVTLLKADSFS